MESVTAKMKRGKSMNWYEKQEKEIETIRERKITVKLSDADCERLARRCGEHNLTIGELIENFIGDLVDGTYSNGSDERDYAEKWFKRCWFGMFSEPTLLSHLIYWGYDPEDYLLAMRNIETDKEEKKNLEEHSEEIRYIDDDMEYWEEEIESMTYYWKPNKETIMDEEIKLIKKWVNERNSFIK